jgi:hypothetical protein
MDGRPDKEGRPPAQGARHENHASSGLTRTLAASPDQTAARERLRRQEHACRNACAAERVMPLVVYYGPRRLLPVPLVELIERGAA